MPIRVLIADDHAVVRDGLAAMLARRREFDVIGEAADGEQAVGQALTLRPDVCLMDLQMPRLGGVDAIERIRAAWPSARILVLTTFDGDEDIYRALQAGAVGYLLKDTPRGEILAAIEAVHGGSRVIPPPIAAKLAERLTTEPLSPREHEVLTRIKDGRSNKEIGADLGISEGTVKAHVNSLLGKLGAADRTQAVTLALQRGILHL